MAQLVELPTELHSRIVGHVHSIYDVLSLICTCSALYEAHRADFLRKAIAHWASKKAFALTEDAVVPGLGKDNGKPEIFAKRPFVLVDSELDDGTLMVSVFLPKFMRGDCYTRKGDLLIERNKVSVFKPVSPAELKKKKIVTLGWEKHVKGKLFTVKGNDLRRAFRCPECGGSRSICPGCGGVSERWPDHFTGCGWSMPCPCCVGENVAYDAKYAQDDDEYIDEMWEELNKMMKS